MTSRGNSSTVTAAIASAVSDSLYSTAMAQESGGGLQANVFVSQGLRYSDLDGTEGRTNFGFGVDTATRSQRLSFDVNTIIDQSLDGGDVLSFDRSNANLANGIESRQTAINSEISYIRSDADDFVLDIDGAPGDLVLDEGIREDIGADLDFAFGREALFGGTVNLGFRETNFLNLESANRIDQQTANAGLNLRFEVDERTTATLGYTWSETDRATGNDTETKRLTTGLQRAVSPTITAIGSVGCSKVRVTGDDETSVNDGISFDFSLVKDRPGGNLRFSLNSDLSEFDRRTTILAGGSVETRRGTFSADLGLSEGDSNTIRPLVTLSYSEALPRGSYSISLRQNFNASTDGDEILNSRLQINCSQDLNQTSQISSDFSYQITDVLGENDDSSRVEFSVGYSRALTKSWNLIGRYTYTFLNEDNAANERENELFLGLETSFAWRP